MPWKNADSFSLSPSYIRCTCPFFFIEIISARKPPFSAQKAAALDDAATTELSSVTIGTQYVRPFIVKLGASPNGM